MTAANSSGCQRILGVRMHPVSMDDLNGLIQVSVESGSKIAIPNQNLHGVYLYHRRPLMRALHDRWDCHIDGMSLVMLGRLLGKKLQREHRVTYIDWMSTLIPLCEQEGWRVFYLGSREGVAERGADVLRSQHPRLQIMTHHGYFNSCVDSKENEAVLRQITAYQPHVLMVGMGMPRQEEWIHLNWDRLTASVVLPSGAAMDYIAGAVRTPPRWMGRIGLEWLYRLATDPVRMAKRYLIEPWALLVWVVRDLIARIVGDQREEPCHWRAANVESITQQRI